MPSFLSCERKTPAGVLPLSFLQSFFSKKRRSSRDSGAARQFAFFAKLSFSRKKAERGESLWHSFRSLAAYCSSSAHPRNICCVGFARMALLAKFIRMRTARSHPRGARSACVERSTEGIKKKKPAGVTPLSFLPSFFQKRRSSRDSGAARQFAFFAELSFS